jgi:DNA-binding CsgD family transcriptional regulator
MNQKWRAKLLPRFRSPIGGAVVELLCSLFLPLNFPRGDVLKLESFGLTAREREFVLEFLGGKTMKEIAIDHGVSFSTVRNALSSVYSKLELSGATELFALGARYRIE